MNKETLYEFAETLGMTVRQAGEALEEFAKKLSEVRKPLIKTFNDLYNELAVVLKNKEIKKQWRQRSIRDKRQQLRRSRKRQQSLEHNKDKPNNWLRIHGLSAKRRVHSKKYIDK